MIQLYIYRYILFFFFWLHCKAHRILLVPRLEVEPWPLATKVQSPNRWTGTEFLDSVRYFHAGDLIWSLVSYRFGGVGGGRDTDIDKCVQFLLMSHMSFKKSTHLLLSPSKFISFSQTLFLSSQPQRLSSQADTFLMGSLLHFSNSINFSAFRSN